MRVRRSRFPGAPGAVVSSTGSLQWLDIAHTERKAHKAPDQHFPLPTIFAVGRSERSRFPRAIPNLVGPGGREPDDQRYGFGEVPNRSLQKRLARPPHRLGPAYGL